MSVFDMQMSCSNPTRQKRSHPKVRTGCQTCKSRRVKCPEERPVCSRCRHGNRECIYAVPKTWLFESGQDKTPNPHSIGLKCLPAVKVPSQAERRSFEFFKRNTAPQFAGQHELAQKFWNIYIPRSASNDSLIYNLAVAMGARHEATLMGSTDADTLATKSHALAISTMARHLSRMRVDLSLLSCALLGAYANLCEEVPATAAIHFSLGLKILREQTSARDIVRDSLGAFIVPMFSELEMGTAIFSTPTVAADVIVPRNPPVKPKLPDALSDLYHAKTLLGDLLGWLIYVQALYRDSDIELAAKVADANELLAVWRRMLVAYSLTVAATFPGLYVKARKMLFQYKLFEMCKGAARNSIFRDACRVRVISLDFTRPHIISIVCALEIDRSVDDTWRPLAPQPSRRQDEDELDIWPVGEPVGHDGLNQMICITLGR